MSVVCPEGHSSDSTDYCDICGLPMGAAGPPIPAASPAAGADPIRSPTVAIPVDTASFGILTGAGSGSQDKPCPNCNAVVPFDDLFCEVCGYDFTTGAPPAPVIHSGGFPVTGGPADQAAVTQAPGGGGAAGGASPAGSYPGPASPPSPLLWVAEVWVDPDWYASQESDEPCPSAGLPLVAPLRERSVLVGRRSASRNIHPQVDCGTDHGVSRRHAQLTTDDQRWWLEDLQSSNGTFIAPAGAPPPEIPVTPGQRVEFSPGDRIYLGAWTRVVVREATPDEQ